MHGLIFPEKHFVPEAFAKVYLVTAPRVLGYKFSPASFWYLYDHEGVISLILAEVNNTFGERRVYILTPRVATTPGVPTVGLDRQKVVSEWEKDFHVSPFSSRKGRYNLRVADPLQPQLHDDLVSICATLLSSKGKVKLVARMSSPGEIFVADRMSTWQQFAFLCRWWWTPFLTCEK